MHYLLLLISLVLAQVSPVNADDCENAETQAMMNECANEALKRSDSQLNAVYKQIEALLKSDGDKTKMLIAAQRAWVAYRDAKCKFSASGVSGGSLYPSVYAGCLDSLTKARIGDLKNYAACQEGDLTCPIASQ